VPQEDTSLEVEQLKKLFQELLDTRRFEINDFLQKEDSEAIMDLAQAASIFKKSKNNKALGLCYNNIANIQYKNAQYHEAAQNFRKAIDCVESLMEGLVALLKKTAPIKGRKDPIGDEKRSLF
jgi:tetratricopeptide (TPR) repeat protein